MCCEALVSQAGSTIHPVYWWKKFALSVFKSRMEKNMYVYVHCKSQYSIEKIISVSWLVKKNTKMAILTVNIVK